MSSFHTDSNILLHLQASPLSPNWENDTGFVVTFKIIWHCYIKRSQFAFCHLLICQQFDLLTFPFCILIYKDLWYLFNIKHFTISTFVSILKMPSLNVELTERSLKWTRCLSLHHLWPCDRGFCLFSLFTLGMIGPQGPLISPSSRSNTLWSPSRRRWSGKNISPDLIAELFTMLTFCTIIAQSHLALTWAFALCVWEECKYIFLLGCCYFFAISFFFLTFCGFFDLCVGYLLLTVRCLLFLNDLLFF